MAEENNDEQGDGQSGRPERFVHADYGTGDAQQSGSSAPLQNGKMPDGKPEDSSEAGNAGSADDLSKKSSSNGSADVAGNGDFTANPYVGADTSSQSAPTVNYGQQYGQQSQYGQYGAQSGTNEPQYGQRTANYGQNVYGAGTPQYGQNAQNTQNAQSGQNSQNDTSYGQSYGYGDANTAPQYGVGGQQPQTDGTPQGAPTFPGSGSFPPAQGAPMPGNGANGGNRGGATKRRSVNSNVVTAIVAAVITAVLCLGLGFAAISNGWVTVHNSGSMSGISSHNSGSGSTTVKGGAAPDWVGVSKNVSDSVVSIQVQVQGGVAKGSGAIIDNKGHVVTNNHVISGAQQIQVTLANGQIYTAKVTGTDATTDLAVIQIDNAPGDLKPVTFANSDNLAVGENVMAVGNPLGYDDTATTGIISALNRPVSVMDDNHSEIVTNAVQIDAAINPGNSGGPTFNAAGQVVGINSSIASSSSSQQEAGSIGIGFAIPSDLVKRISNEIVTNGSVKHVMLGITIKSATVKADGINRAGAQITGSSNGGSAVTPGSPAAKAGLKDGDTIVAFNGNAVGSNSALLGYVRAASMGDKAKLTVVRGGKTMEVDVTLDQEEKQVSGSNRRESGNGLGQQGQQDQQGDGDGDGDDDGGALTDPFGLW